MVEVDTHEGRYDHHADPVIPVRCFLPCGEGLRCRTSVLCVCRVCPSAISGVWYLPAAEDESPVFPEPCRDAFDLNHLQILLFKNFWRTVSSFSPFRRDRRVRFSRFSGESQALAPASFWIADSNCSRRSVVRGLRSQRYMVSVEIPISSATAQRGTPAAHAVHLRSMLVFVISYLISFLAVHLLTIRVYYDMMCKSRYSLDTYFLKYRKDCLF